MRPWFPLAMAPDRQWKRRRWRQIDWFCVSGRTSLGRNLPTIQGLHWGDFDESNSPSHYPSKRRHCLPSHWRSKAIARWAPIGAVPIRENEEAIHATDVICCVIDHGTGCFLTPFRSCYISTPDATRLAKRPFRASSSSYGPISTTLTTGVLLKRLDARSAEFRSHEDNRNEAGKIFVHRRISA
jgi:hypothetical protein